MDGWMDGCTHVCMYVLCVHVTIVMIRLYDKIYFYSEVSEAMGTELGQIETDLNVVRK